MMAGRKLRLAMAGGGEGAFIGGVHRMAAALDGDWALVAGTFSSDVERNRRSGEALGLDPARVHATIDALLADERTRPRGSGSTRWRSSPPTTSTHPWRSRH